MDSKIIISITSGILYMAILLSIPVRKKIDLRKAGKLIASLPKAKVANDFLIISVCACLIVLCTFKSFGLMMNLIVSGCALMGTFISSKEIAHLGHEGLYENCIIANSNILPLKEMMNIPEILVSDKDKEYFDKTTLMIKKQNGNIQNYIFSSHEEKMGFINKLLEIKPELGKE